MKLEDGAIQAYRQGKIIKNEGGICFDINSKNLPIISCASEESILGEWEIQLDKKQQLKEKVLWAMSQNWDCCYSKEEYENAKKEMIQFIETLEIK